MKECISCRDQSLERSYCEKCDANWFTFEEGLNSANLLSIQEVMNSACINLLSEENKLVFDAIHSKVNENLSYEEVVGKIDVVRYHHESVTEVLFEGKPLLVIYYPEISTSATYDKTTFSLKYQKFY